LISSVFNVFYIVSIVLQSLLLVLLLSNGFRKYPLLFLYTIAQLLTDFAESAASRQFGRQTVQFANLYWGDEILLDLILFVMLIVFTYQSLEDNPWRATAGRFLAGVLALAIAAPFALYYNHKLFTTAWFNGTSQWLNFSAAIMNLALWSALLTNKKRDPQLLTVSIGLGVTVAGAAMYFGLRKFLIRGEWRDFANMVGVLMHLAGVCVWCWAFRPARMRAGGALPNPPADEPRPAATTSGY
jgi:hypothetical protein